MQLEFNFNDIPTVFQQDCTNVNYALSYLKGTTLDWFEPRLFLTGIMELTWLSSWGVFVNQLQISFGLHDPIRDAKAKLEHLHLKENQHITKYMINFARLFTQCEWGEVTL